MARGVVLSDRARARSRGRRAFSGVVFVWRGTVVGAYAGDDPAFELLHIIPPRYPTLLATAESVWREIRMFNEQSHMNILSTIEKQRFESLFGMETGYVLNFTDQSFAGFFRQDVGINISDPRFSYNGPSKAKRLRAFWEIEEPTIVGRALEKLLELWRYLNEPGKDERADGNYEYCVLSAARLLGRELKQETESDFLRRDFGAISVEGMGLNVNVEQILGARVKEAIDCVAAGAALSAILMCGSVLEGLLLSVALKNPAVFNCASGSPKQKDTGKVRPFHEWTLASLIDVAHEVGVLRLDVKKFGHGVRDFRNYIHPYEQMASKFTPDQHTAQICLQVLRAALVGLKENRGMVPSI